MGCVSEQAQKSEAPAEQTQGARRYPRTFSGLVASMIVLIVAVVGYWVAQNLTHDAGTSVGAVDYRSEVAEIQQASGSADQLDVVYPTSLPAGWKVTSADYQPGEQPEWRLGAVTDHNTFVGLVLSNGSTVGLVKTYVDADASSDGSVSMPSGVGDQWSAYSDTGGDHGYVTQLGGSTLLVYGSGSKDDFATFMSALTQDPIDASSSAS